MNTIPPKVHFPRTRSLWYGFTLPYRAFRLIVINKSLLFWSSLPLVLTFILFVYGISQLQDWAIMLLQESVARLGFAPDSWIGWFSILSGRMILWMVAALTFIFTRDGELVNCMTQPGRYSKIYDVWIRGRISEEQLRQVLKGVKTAIGALKVNRVAVSYA